MSENRFNAITDQFTDNDIAGAVVVTRQEMSDPATRGTIIEDKVNNLKRALINEIERSWGIVIEYAENTTGANADSSGR